MTTPTPPKEAMATEVEQVVADLGHASFTIECAPTENTYALIYDEAAERIAKAANDAIALLHRQQAEIERLKGMVPRWIYVADRLPEPGRVLVAFDNDEAVHHIAGERGIDVSYFDGEDFCICAHVHHWQPLPSAPTENDHEA